MAISGLQGLQQQVGSSTAASGSDISHVAAGSRHVHRLHHRLLRTDAFQHRVGTDAVGQVQDSRHSVVATLGNDVGGTEVAGEFLPILVAAHGEDPRGPQLPGRKHAEQADRAVANDDYR